MKLNFREKFSATVSSVCSGSVDGNLFLFEVDNESNGALFSCLSPKIPGIRTGLRD